MLGFLKKDLLMIKGNMKMMSVVVIVFLLAAFSGEGNYLFLPAFLSVVLMISTFSYDEYNKTDAYIAALPNGKENAVKAKYLATLLVSFISSLLIFLVASLITLKNEETNLMDILLNVSGCFIGIVLLISILYPFIYKFGVEKSRIGIFLGIFGITGLGAILMKNGFPLQIPESILSFLENNQYILIPVITIICLFISYQASKHIYLKKEF